MALLGTLEYVPFAVSGGTSFLKLFCRVRVGEFVRALFFGVDCLGVAQIGFAIGEFNFCA